MSTMAERIKQLRLERQMTQEELGNIVGLQKQAIWKYENGNVTNMKQSTIKSLSDFFGVTPSYLMGYSDNRTERDIDVNKMTEEDKTIILLLKDMPIERRQEALSFIKYLSNQTKDM